MYIVDLLAIQFVDCISDKVALDPSGKSGAFRHHRKDYTASAEAVIGLSNLCRLDCKSGFVLPKLVRRIFSKFDSSGKSPAH
jgi:hypothetical protein